MDRSGVERISYWSMSEYLE